MVESTPRRATPIKYSSFAQIRGTTSGVATVKKEDTTIFAAFGITKKATKQTDIASVTRGVSD